MSAEHPHLPLSQVGPSLVSQGGWALRGAGCCRAVELGAPQPWGEPCLQPLCRGVGVSPDSALYVIKPQPNPIKAWKKSALKKRLFYSVLFPPSKSLFLCPHPRTHYSLLYPFECKHLNLVEPHAVVGL